MGGTDAELPYEGQGDRWPDPSLADPCTDAPDVESPQVETIMQPEHPDRDKPLPLSELRAQAITSAVPPAVPDLRPPDDTPPGPGPLAEIIAPMQVFLRTEHGDQPGRRAPVMVALT